MENQHEESKDQSRNNNTEKLNLQLRSSSLDSGSDHQHYLSQAIDPTSKLQLSSTGQVLANRVSPIGGQQFASSASPLGLQQNNPTALRQPKQKYLNFANAGDNKTNQQFSSMDRREVAMPRKSTLEKIEEETDYEDTSIDWGQRKRIFVLFVLGNLFLNYDNGVIPACLLQIERDLHMSQSGMALMGSLVYFGLSVSSLFVSVIFQKFKASNVLGFNMIANAVACFLFSISTNHLILAFMRFMLGFTQAFCVIYGPVWVNEFSPKKSNTKWMAILHSFVVIGIMIGYIFGAITVTLLGRFLSWRFAFMLQGWFMIVIGVCFIFSDNKALDIFASAKAAQQQQQQVMKQRPKSYSDAHRELQVFGQAHSSEDGSGNNQGRSQFDGRSSANFGEQKKSVRMDTISLQKNELQIFIAQFKALITNWIFLMTTLSLCCLYFVVTGIQFWMTAYCIKVLDEDPGLVTISYTLCSITAPIPGAAMGGYLADKNGGYKGKNVLTAIKLCTAFGTCAFIFAAPIGFQSNLVYIMPLLWSLLFFGAALIPTATGVVVNSVSREHQAASSSMSQLIFNLGGYFLAPVLSAAVMDQFEDEVEGMLWGFRVCLWWSFFSLMFLLIAWVCAARKFENYQQFHDENENNGNKSPFEYEENELTMPELNLEILRRRMHSYSF